MTRDKGDYMEMCAEIRFMELNFGPWLSGEIRSKKEITQGASEWLL